ncbi:MAG: translation initiation factor IF-3 [Bacilli bacterium]|nr:translation initiation factor IF-3 [Bacilli bacterium]
MFRIAKQENTLINEEITFAEVMVIGPNGEKMGVKPISDALTLASYAGLDLVLMNGGNNPVCKIMDYNKFKYEKTKKEKEAKKKQRELNLELKEYRLSVTIDTHDFETKLRNATEYIKKGHKIKVSVRFKGRQLAHPELGKEVILKFADRVKDIAVSEGMPKMEGRSMSLILTPIK